MTRFPTSVAVLLLSLAACAPDPSGRHHRPGPDAEEAWTAPDNTWPVSAPPEDLVGEGCGRGQVFPDFRLPDQHGDVVSLWQFYGDVVLLHVSAMWIVHGPGGCGGGPQDTLDLDPYGDRGFTRIEVVLEDSEGGLPDRDDLQLLAGFFGILDPVVGDGDRAGVGCALEDESLHAVVVLGRDLRVTEVLPWPDAEELEAAIEEAL
jgi:hypothetical protein